MKKSGFSDKRYRVLARLAEKRGWTVEMRRNNHVRWTSPDGRIAHTVLTASDHRSFLNDRAKLRRLGLDDRPS